MSGRTIVITGNVQGVFFRDRTKVMAKEFGVKGWVKNTHDGAVEIHAEGTEEALQKLEEWCHLGPAAAHVENVEVKEAEEEGHKEFEIIW